jgi:hypothetical protein
MWKRVALLAAIAALTVVKPSTSVAQAWDGGGWDGAGWDGAGWDGAGWGGGGWGGFGGGAVTVTVGFPQRRPFPCCERRFIPRPTVCCERPFIPRPIVCCERPFIPRPVFCCERRFFRPFVRPPYYYGDNFAPYAYNWNGGYGYGGYGGW